MGELGVKQCHNVTPRAEGAGLLVDAILAGDLRNEMSSNELAKLTHYNGAAPGCLFAFLRADPERDQPPANLITFSWDGCGKPSGVARPATTRTSTPIAENGRPQMAFKNGSDSSLLVPDRYCWSGWEPTRFP